MRQRCIGDAARSPDPIRSDLLEDACISPARMEPVKLHRQRSARVGPRCSACLRHMKGPRWTSIRWR
eukprot:5966809-Pyramimonas_sp.AAC.1